MIRVFPRKTKWSPNDELVFFGPPPSPLFREPVVRVSVLFTWDIPKGERLYEQWRECSDDCQIGGPAFDDPGGEFVPGRFVKDGVTITSRGCPKACGWCLVSQREGLLRELPIMSGNIVNDNNLLACSRPHIERVFAMLSDQKTIEFKGGLDIDYLAPWHVEAFKKLRIKGLWVACDNDGGLKRLDKAADLLADFSIEKKRCYVLLAHGDDTPERAEHRCNAVYEKGFLPFAQLFRPIERREYSPKWKSLQRKWARPAIYRSKRKT